VPKGEGSMRSTPKVALTGSQLDPRLVRLVRPFPQGAVWKFLSGIDRLGMAGLPRTTHPPGGGLMGDLFDDGDPFEDPTWQRTELMSGPPVHRHGLRVCCRSSAAATKLSSRCSYTASVCFGAAGPSI